jgi:hypothetical protein
MRKTFQSVRVLLQILVGNVSSMGTMIQVILITQWRAETWREQWCQMLVGMAICRLDLCLPFLVECMRQGAGHKCIRGS